VIRLAAVGDIHFGADMPGHLRPHLEAAADELDLLLLAGDLTRRGELVEAHLLADELRGLPVPIVAVLGNHDYHQDAQEEVAAILEAAGVRVLEGDHALVAVRDQVVGVAGVKGFGGGFAGVCVTEFGEPETKDFALASRRAAEALARSLLALSCDVRIALTHYSPVEATLVGEHPGLWPFLGSYLLAEAVDAGGAVLALHGHAHSGSADVARTPGGVPVRNVAQPLIRQPFALIELAPPGPCAAAQRPDSIGTTSLPRV
jgi:Icc-related predicted phosphoesterase